MWYVTEGLMYETMGPVSAEYDINDLYEEGGTITNTESIENTDTFIQGIISGDIDTDDLDNDMLFPDLNMDENTYNNFA